jgi:hypothetical protein
MTAEFNEAYRGLMNAVRSDASRRRRTVAGIDIIEPSPDDVAGIGAAMAVAGAPVALAGRALATAPRTIGAGVGGLFGVSAGNEAEAQSRRGAPLPVDPADVAAAEKLPEHLRPQYLDLSARNRARQLNRAEREALTGMNKILSDSAAAGDAAAQARQAAEATRAEEARREVLSTAPKPFNEQFPTWNSLQGFLPLAVGAATTLPYALRGAAGASSAARAWRGAAERGMAATDAPTLATNNALAQAYARQFPAPSVGTTLSPYAVPATIGAIEGAGVANLPEAYNAFLPPENPEVRAYREYLKQLPPDHPARARAERVLSELPQTMPARDAAFDHFGSTNFLRRMAVGALEGAGGAVFGTTLAKPFYPSEKGLPRAQTQALSDRVSGSGLDDATRAIQAESQAMGSVLPLPPARQQLMAQPLPPPVMPAPVQTPSYQPRPQLQTSNNRPQITEFDVGATGAAIGFPFVWSDGSPINALLAYYQGQQPAY